MDRPIIIDCDPGLDDSIAITTAHKIQGIDVIGITTTAGNACVENTSRNALNLLDTISWELPVVIGSINPLIRERRLSSKKTGLGEVLLKESNRKFHEMDVTDYIYEQAKKHNKELEILELAPMTNIAKTIIKHPDIKTMIKSITFMGGTTGQGNITPSAEFNMYIDPHAAEIVFNSGIPLTMVGLGVTKKAFLSSEDMDYFKVFNNIHSKLIGELLQSIHNRECICGENAIEVHDLVALATMVFPDIVRKKKFKASIETNNKQNLGMLLFDYRNIGDEEKNIDIAVDIDVESFIHWFKSLIC